MHIIISIKIFELKCRRSEHGKKNKKKKTFLRMKLKAGKAATSSMPAEQSTHKSSGLESYDFLSLFLSLFPFRVHLPFLSFGNTISSFFLFLPFPLVLVPSGCGDKVQLEERGEKKSSSSCNWSRKYLFLLITRLTDLGETDVGALVSQTGNGQRRDSKDAIQCQS